MKRAAGPALILGVNGLSGAELASQLAAAGERFVGVDLAPAPSLRIRAPFEYRSFDLLADRAAWERLLSETQPSAVYNFMRVADSEAKEAEYARTVLEGLAALGLKETSALFLGSAAEYGPLGDEHLPIRETAPTNPLSPYGRGKLAHTKLVLELSARHGLRANVARPFNIIGLGMPRQLFIPEFLAQCERGGVVEVRNLASTRDFVDAIDSVALCRRIAASGVGGEVFNICTGRETSIQDIVDYYVKKLANPTLEIREVKGALPEIVRSVGDNRKVLALPGEPPRLRPLEATLDAIYNEWRATR